MSLLYILLLPSIGPGCIVVVVVVVVVVCWFQPSSSITVVAMH